MKLIEIIYSAYHALVQNRKRSLLTMFGIVVGVASVITIMSLGRGFEHYTIKNLAQSDSANVVTTISFEPSDYKLYESQDVSFFNATDLSRIGAIEGVKKVQADNTDTNQLFMTLILSGTSYNKTVALNSGSGDAVKYGRKLTADDGRLLNKVCEISLDTAKAINPDLQKVLGFGLDVDGELYTVVGIFSGTAQDLFSLTPDIQIPKKTYQYHQATTRKVQSIKLTIDSAYKPSLVTNRVLKQLKDSGSMSAFGSYSTVDLSSLTDGIGKVLRLLTYFISTIAGISLFIAGVGVMNMMYISVSERVREIGICRAMGAKRRDIRLQFLFEGLLLTLTAGVVGYLIGFLVALLISLFLPFTVRPDLFTTTLALGISLIIGLVFSIMPATKAANKDLIDILR
ncbi:MAG: ABC transporter permease [Streptococcaceae bacterium]|jgi:putative ABC transport system permease protein|nr:ABC transporter permease [Streptococcaceae bacterium]